MACPALSRGRIAARFAAPRCPARPDPGRPRQPAAGQAAARADPHRGCRAADRRGLAARAGRRRGGARRPPRSPRGPGARPPRSRSSARSPSCASRPRTPLTIRRSSRPLPRTPPRLCGSSLPIGSPASSIAPGSTVLAATLLTGKGVRAEFGPTVDLGSCRPASSWRGSPRCRAIAARILVVETSEIGPGPDAVVTAVSVPALLVAATPQGGAARAGPAHGGRHRPVLAESSGPFDPGALPGEVLDLATMAAHDSDGRSGRGPARASTAGRWSSPRRSRSSPCPCRRSPRWARCSCYSSVFTIWMARQILRPAGAARGVAVATPRAVRERPRGGAARQPHRPRQPPGVPGGGRPDGRGRPPLRDRVLAGAHRHRRVQARSTTPRATRSATSCWPRSAR